MDLALVTGHRPDVLSNHAAEGWALTYARTMSSDRPLTHRRGRHLVLHRDLRSERDSHLSAEQIRSVGGRAAAAIARSRLEETATLGYWIRLMDVLDQTVVPAVKFHPNECGLRLDELEEILAGLLASRRVAGMNLSIFDPELDPDRRLATLLVDLLVRVLRAPR